MKQFIITLTATALGIVVGGLLAVETVIPRVEPIDLLPKATPGLMAQADYTRDEQAFYDRVEDQGYSTMQHTFDQMGMKDVYWCRLSIEEAFEAFEWKAGPGDGKLHEDKEAGQITGTFLDAQRRFYWTGTCCARTGVFEQTMSTNL